MKRYYILAIAAATSVAAMAQDYTYAERFSRVDPMGSARSQAMGGAFGALGADFTSSVLNPAGFGIYRASEMGMTLGVNTRNISTNIPLLGGRTLDGTESKDTHLNFLQIGAALNSSTIRQESGIVGHTFAVTYNKLADYDAMYDVTNPHSHSSLLDYFLADERAYNDFEANLAWDAENLFYEFTEYDDQVFDENGKPVYDENGDEVWEFHHVEVDHSAWECPWEDADGNPYFDQGMRSEYSNNGIVGNVSINRHFYDKGDKGEFAVNYAQNIANQFFWGVKMGVVSHTFKREMTHNEKYNGDVLYDYAPNSFVYRSSLNQDATGFALGAGFLYIPMPEIRIGLAVHAPTFYSVTDILESSFKAKNQDEHFSPVNEWKYKYTAPARVIFSLAGVVGRLGIISADYEFVGNKSSKFRNSEEASTEDGYYTSLNDQLKNDLSNIHKLRIGAEVKPTSILALRLGYKMQTSPYSSNVVKRSYLNRDITGGIGLRFSNVYLDFAYVNNMVKDEAWILPDSEYYEYEAPKASSYDQKTHRVTFTIGYRF